MFIFRQWVLMCFLLSFYQILMSVPWNQTLAATTLIAPIPSALTAVLVNRDLLEMVQVVKVTSRLS